MPVNYAAFINNPFEMSMRYDEARLRQKAYEENREQNKIDNAYKQEKMGLEREQLAQQGAAQQAAIEDRKATREMDERKISAQSMAPRLKYEYSILTAAKKNPAQWPLLRQHAEQMYAGIYGPEQAQKIMSTVPTEYDQGFVDNGIDMRENFLEKQADYVRVDLVNPSDPNDSRVDFVNKLSGQSYKPPKGYVTKEAYEGATARTKANKSSGDDDSLKMSKRMDLMDRHYKTQFDKLKMKYPETLLLDKNVRDKYEAEVNEITQKHNTDTNLMLKGDEPRYYGKSGSAAAPVNDDISIEELFKAGSLNIK